MDGLDGVVARKRAHLQSKQIMNPESIGFAIDGLCDGIYSNIFFFFYFYSYSDKTYNFQILFQVLQM